MTDKKRGEISWKKKKYSFANKKIRKFDVQWMKKLTSKEAKKKKKKTHTSAHVQKNEEKVYVPRKDK